MDTNFNYMNFGNIADGGGDGIPSLNLPISRQSSIYSLTFSELQSTIGGSNKDFGSMNMDELLKNLWNAEGRQITGSINGGFGGEGNLQRQGSLTLPRTLSQKTVDEVWKDIFKDNNGGNEVTLEEFLAKAGVVREETDLASKEEDDRVNPTSLGLEGDKILKSIDHVAVQKVPELSGFGQGDRKKVPYDQLGFGAKRFQVSDFYGLPIHSRGSLEVPSEGMTKCNDEMSALSPVPCTFNGGSRGRKVAPLDKVVERRQRRMIKNRESAARSRARKQAYTIELEAEIAKLKEENDELRRKQADMMEMQENEIMQEKGAKRRRLRRTQTGPW